jgi:proteasome lid subunit RPN8/RPN11
MANTAATEQPDVRQLSATELPAVTFPGGRSDAFRVYFDPGVHGRLWQHAAENLAVEVCGVLVGTWGRDAAGPFVAISEAIRGEAAASKFAEVTFTHETWAKINHEMDTKFSQLSIVGWYHTHPDFGVFLSDRDVFIQQHFFSGPGQIAHVLDPIRKTEGVFVWQKGKPTLTPYFWVGDKLLASQSTAARTDETSGSAPASAPSSNTPKSGRGTPLLDWLTQGLAYLCLFLLGFILAGWLADGERYRSEQGAVARTALLLGVKPGLREALDRCLAELKDGVQEGQALAKGLPDEEKEKWNGLQARLNRTRQQLLELEAQYCLTAAETQRLLQQMGALLAASQSGLSNQEQARLAREIEKTLAEQLQKNLGGIPKQTTEPTATESNQNKKQSPPPGQK